MEVTAISKGVRMSPRKVQVVAALVRGRSAEDAYVILEHTPRRAALPVLKTIKSAVANATHNHNVLPEGIAISEISVTNGPALKRYRPAAHGRALPFKRRSCHIRVVVSGKLRPTKRPTAAKKPVDKPEAAKSTSSAKKEAK